MTGFVAEQLTLWASALRTIKPSRQVDAAKIILRR